MNEQQIIELLTTYKAGELNAEQIAKLETWYLQQAKNSTYQLSDTDAFESRQRLQSKLPLSYAKPVKKLWATIAVAASILLIASLSVLLLKKKDQAPIPTIAYHNDVEPGINSATLTLANGTKIKLKDAANGKMASEHGVLISKTTDGNLVYKVTNAISGVTQYNTLATSNGEQSQIELPDGTKVWLNAASKIKFPTQFTGQQNRLVELDGEAYFEVSKDKNHPFIVRTAQQSVQVLGTHFNISSYSDDEVNKTTLLEGSVRISSSRASEVGITARPETSGRELPEASAILKPGEQAISSGKALKVTQIDTELAVAWKNNKFMFEGQKIKDVMKMIARWYNVEVIYEGTIPEDYFTGSVSRFDKVSKVLNILELTKNIHFKIEGRRITVMK